MRNLALLVVLLAVGALAATGVVLDTTGTDVTLTDCASGGS